MADTEDSIQWSTQTYNVMELVEKFQNGGLQKHLYVQSDCSDECNNLTLKQGDVLQVCGVEKHSCVAGEFPTRLGEIRHCFIPMTYKAKLKKLAKTEYIFPTVKDLLKWFPSRVRVTYAPSVGPKITKLVGHNDVLQLVKFDKNKELLICLFNNKEIKLPLTFRGDFEELPDEGEKDIEEVMTKYLCPQWVSFLNRQNAKQDFKSIKYFEGDVKLNYEVEQTLLVCKHDTRTGEEMLTLPVRFGGIESSPLFYIQENTSTMCDNFQFDMSKCTVNDAISMMNFVTKCNIISLEGAKPVVHRKPATLPRFKPVVAPRPTNIKKRTADTDSDQEGNDTHSDYLTLVPDDSSESLTYDMIAGSCKSVARVSPPQTPPKSPHHPRKSQNVPQVPPKPATLKKPKGLGSSSKGSDDPGSGASHRGQTESGGDLTYTRTTSLGNLLLPSAINLEDLSKVVPAPEPSLRASHAPKHTRDQGGDYINTGAYSEAKEMYLNMADSPKGSLTRQNRIPPSITKTAGDYINVDNSDIQESYLSMEKSPTSNLEVEKSKSRDTNASMDDYIDLSATPPNPQHTPEEEDYFDMDTHESKYSNNLASPRLSDVNQEKRRRPIPPVPVRKEDLSAVLPHDSKKDQTETGPPIHYVNTSQQPAPFTMDHPRAPLLTASKPKWMEKLSAMKAMHADDEERLTSVESIESLPTPPPSSKQLEAQLQADIDDGHLTSIESLELPPTYPPNRKLLGTSTDTHSVNSDTDEDDELGDFEDTYQIVSAFRARDRSSSDGALPSINPPTPLTPRPKTLGAGTRDRGPEDSNTATDDVADLPKKTALNRKVSKVIDVKDIPDNLRQLTVKGFSDTLRLLNLKEFADVCEQEMIDGEFFTDMTEAELQEQPFGLRGFKLRKAVNLKDKAWRPVLE